MSLLGRRSPLAEMPGCWRKIPISLIDRVLSAKNLIAMVRANGLTRADETPHAANHPD
jgi:hypothetical protein